MKVVAITECESTQLVARQADVCEPTMFITDVQTGGVGRTGPWVFAPGNLACTWAMPWREPGLAYLVATIAVFSVLQDLLAASDMEKVRISWPNDLYFAGRKCCGILCEQAKDYVLVGIGMNIAGCPPGASCIPPIALSPRQLADRISDRLIFQATVPHAHTIRVYAENCIQMHGSFSASEYGDFQVVGVTEQCCLVGKMSDGSVLPLLKIRAMQDMAQI